MTVYLDHNATTPVDSRVLEVMLPYMQNTYGNPSSVHRHGRLTRAAIDVAREQIAAAINVSPTQIIFTSGGTEANNIVAYNVLNTNRNAHIAVSAIEHPSMLEIVRTLSDDYSLIPVNSDGVVEVDKIASILKPDSRLLSVMLANNETGAIQNIAEIVEQIQYEQIIMHTDASQALGKMPVDFVALGIQMMTLSSHKVYGPLGAGALVVDKKLSLKPMMCGGGHEYGVRPGTENVAAIAGFGMAVELANSELQTRVQHMQTLRDEFEKALQALSGVQIFAEQAKRLPNTTQFGIAAMHGETVLMQLDRKGFAVSSGSACHSDVTEPSHVLRAMSVEDDFAITAIRVSLGKETRQNHIRDFLQALTEIIRQNKIKVA